MTTIINALGAAIPAVLGGVWLGWRACIRRRREAERGYAGRWQGAPPERPDQGVSEQREAVE